MKPLEMKPLTTTRYGSEAFTPKSPKGDDPALGRARKLQVKRH